MRLSFSRLAKWWECPAKYQEHYEFNLEPLNADTESLRFGTRAHQLLAEQEIEHGQLEEPLEAEARALVAGYRGRYPVDDWDLVASEVEFEHALPRRCKPCGAWVTAEGWCQACDSFTQVHSLKGVIDKLVILKEPGNPLAVVEFKTERRGSKRNSLAAWGVKAQASLYYWAVEAIWPERRLDKVVVDILTRCSPAGLKPPSYTRHEVQRSEQAIAQAVEDANWVGDQIEAMQFHRADAPWPMNREACVNPTTGWKCEFYELHAGERAQELVELKFQQRKERE